MRGPDCGSLGGQHRSKAYVNDMFNRRMLVERGSGSGVGDASGHIITNAASVAR